jgi:hypothetical protein
MFTPRTISRRTAVLSAGLATATALVLFGPSSASADPPGLNVDPCVQELARAAEWPGDDSAGTRFVSDAYDSYLSRQPACNPGT